MSRQLGAAAYAAVVLLALAPARMGRADPTTRPAELLTPRSAAEEAIRANPDLRAARAAVDAARARLAQAARWPNPELGVSGASDWVFANEGERRLDVEVAQPLPVAGRLVRAREAARVDVEIAVAEAREFERTLIAEVSGRVAAIGALARSIESRDRMIMSARDLARIAARRLAAAEISEADLNLLEIELARFEQERRLLTLERAALEARLAAQLYRPPGAPLAVADDLDTALFAPAPGSDLLAAALVRRPDLQRLRLEAERARAEARLARAEAWEDWSVGASYARERSAIDDAGLELVDRDNLVGVALRAPLPLWNRNQGRIAAALAEGRRAGDRVAALERTIRAEVEAAQQRVAGLAGVAHEYREALLPRSERNVELLAQAYRQGLAPITALVQAQQQLAETSVRYAETLGELRRAEVELETAAAASPLLSDASSQEPRP